MSQRAGWYDDPENPDHLRYFDGVVWTSNTTPKAPPVAPPPAQPTTPMPTEPNRGPAGHAGYDGGQQPYGPPPQYGQPQQYGPAQQYGGARAYGSLGVKTTPDGQPLASYGQRVGAYLLDGLIAGAISLLVGWYWVAQFVRWYSSYLDSLLRQIDSGGSPSVDQAAIASQASSYVLPIVAVSLVVQVVYQVAFLTRRGATPGKMVVGIGVRRRDRPGPPDLATALKRVALGVAVSLVGLLPAAGAAGSLVSILDLLWPLWDDKRQALHDKIAGTNVVVTRGRR